MAFVALHRLLTLRLALVACFVSGSFAWTQAPAPVEARTAALSRILGDYHDEQLKHEPVLATAAGGDPRYNDQLPDLSASAENAWIARGQTYILRLSEIDVTGLPDKVRIPAERLLTALIEEQNASHLKDWQQPLVQFTTLDTRLLALAAHLPFKTVKDYDDYIARLKKLPNAFSQIMTNLQLNADQTRLPTKGDAEKVQSRVQAIVSQPGETNPYAAPLARFPPAIALPDRKRIKDDLLDSIAASVVPSYQRLGRFLAAMPVPTVHVGVNGEARALLASTRTP